MSPMRAYERREMSLVRHSLFEQLKTRRYADLKKLGGENETGSYCGRPVFVNYLDTQTPYLCWGSEDAKRIGAS